MPSIDLPAGTVHYRAHGPAEGRPVVLVHGFLVDDGLWSDVPQRLGERGLRAIAPTWPLGAHRTAMRPGADLSPAGVAAVVLAFLEALDLRDVVLVGNDTGGAVCQEVVTTDDSRVGALVLTDCDAFDVFPPAPFGQLFRLCRHPALARAVLQGVRPAALRHSPLGFGRLARRPLDAAVTRRWVEPYLTDAGVRRDTATFACAWRGDELVDVSPRLASFAKPALVCWAPSDRFFPIALGRRLATTLPHARLVEIDDAGTFVSLDQPQRLADEIAAFVGGAS